MQGGGADIRRVRRLLRWYMDDRTRHNPVEIAAWLESVRQVSVDETGLIETQTAEEAESGVDMSRLRANLRLTPVVTKYTRLLPQPVCSTTNERVWVPAQLEAWKSQALLSAPRLRRRGAIGGTHRRLEKHGVVRASLSPR
jgi:hypothetical protein